MKSKVDVYISQSVSYAYGLVLYGCCGCSRSGHQETYGDIGNMQALNSQIGALASLVNGGR